MIKAIGIAISGLQAASKRVHATASNIANLQTSGSITGEGKAPYSALTTTQSAQVVDGQGAGVRAEYASKNPGFVPAFDPDSPFADENGVIGVPNVDLAEEAVNLNLAEIAYKANAAVIKTAAELSDELLKTFDKKI